MMTMTTHDHEKKNWVHVPLEELITNSSYIQCFNSESVTSWLSQEPQKSKCFFFLENDQTSFVQHQTHLELDFMAEQVDHAYFEVETITDAWRTAEKEWEYQTCSLKEELELQSKSLKNSQHSNEILNQTVKELERKILNYTQDIVQYQNGALEANKLKKKLKKIIDSLQKKNHFLEAHLKNYDLKNRERHNSAEQTLLETKQLQKDYVDCGTQSLSHGIHSPSVEPSQTLEVTHGSTDSPSAFRQINSTCFEKDDSSKNQTGIDFQFFRSCPNCKSFYEHLQTETKKLKGFIKEQQVKFETLSTQYSVLVELLEHRGINPTKCLDSIYYNKQIASFNLVPLDKFQRISTQLKLETRLYQLMKHQCGLAIARELRQTINSSIKKNEFRKESQISTSTQTDDCVSFFLSKMCSMCLKQTPKSASCTVVQPVAISLSKETLERGNIKPSSHHPSLSMMIKEAPEYLHESQRISLPLLDSFDGFSARRTSTSRSSSITKTKPLIPINVKPSRSTFLPAHYSLKQKTINTSCRQPVGVLEDLHTAYSPSSSTQNILSKTWKSSMSSFMASSLEDRENKSMSSSQHLHNKTVKPLLGDSTSTYPKLYENVSTYKASKCKTSFDVECKTVTEPTQSCDTDKGNKNTHQYRQPSQPIGKSTLQMRESLPSLRIQNFFNKAKGMIRHSSSLEKMNKDKSSISSASRHIEKDTSLLTLKSTCLEHLYNIKNHRSLSSDIKINDREYPNKSTSHSKSILQARMTQSYPAASHTGSEKNIVRHDTSQECRNTNHVFVQPSQYTSPQAYSDELNLSSSKNNKKKHLKTELKFYSRGMNLERNLQVFSDLSLTPIYSRSVPKNASKPSEGFISYALNSLNIPGGTLSSTSTMSHSLSENLLSRSRFNSLTL